MPLLDTKIVCHRSASDRAQETMQDRFVAMLGIGANDRGTDRIVEQGREADAGLMDGRERCGHHADSRAHRGQRQGRGRVFGEMLDARLNRSEAHKYELQSLMSISYAVFC